MREGFARVDREIKESCKRADERFATKEEINRRFDEVDGKFEQVLFQLGRVNDRLDSYARVAFVTGVGLFGAVVVAILGRILEV